MSANLDSLDYAAKRAAIDALGVEVRIWREGATDEHGTPLPRWVLSVEPVDPDILNGDAHHDVHNVPLARLVFIPKQDGSLHHCAIGAIEASNAGDAA